MQLTTVFALCSFVYTAMRAHEQYGVRPFAFHATYSADKLMKLREEVRSNTTLQHNLSTHPVLIPCNPSHHRAFSATRRSGG